MPSLHPCCDRQKGSWGPYSKSITITNITTITIRIITFIITITIIIALTIAAMRRFFNGRTQGLHGIVMFRHAYGVSQNLATC